MKLLKLVPDNTNFHFMKWRNIALILSILATVASLALSAVSTAVLMASTAFGGLVGRARVGSSATGA